MGGHSTVLLLAWLAMQVVTIFGDDTLPALTQETDQNTMRAELETKAEGATNYLDKLRRLTSKFGAETDLKDLTSEIKNQGQMIRQELKAQGDYLKVQGQVVLKVATDLKELKELVGVLGTSFRDLRKGIVDELENQDKKIEWAITDGSLVPRNTSWVEANFNTINDKMDVLEYQLCQHMRGSNQCDVTDPRKTDDGPTFECSQAVSSGVHTVTAGGSNFDAYCVLEGSEKWTVIQRRTNGRVSFARNWAAYREGFGDIAGEFWLGNDNIHRLTAGGLTRLRVDLEDWHNNKHTVMYNTFMVAGEVANYRLTVSGFTGSTGSNPPGDVLIKQAEGQFSTVDDDHDANFYVNCASKYGGGGGWWFTGCVYANLNGVYNGTAITGIYWGGWGGSLKATTMMLTKP